MVVIKNNLDISEIENMGAEFYKKINSEKNSEYLIFSDSVIGKHDNFIGYFLHGIKLKSYEFKKYKSKTEQKIITVNVEGVKNKPSAQVK